MCIPSVEYWLRQFLRSYPLLRGVFFFISTSEFFMLLYSVKFADILFKFTVIPSMANYILPFPHFLSSEPLDECLLHLALHVDSHLGWCVVCPRLRSSRFLHDNKVISRLCRVNIGRFFTILHTCSRLNAVPWFFSRYFSHASHNIFITGVALICTINTIVIFVEVICFFGCYCANVIIRHLHLCWVYLRDDSHCISLQHVPRKYLLSDHCQWLGHRWSLQTILLRLRQLGL